MKTYEMNDLWMLHYFLCTEKYYIYIRIYICIYISKEWRNSKVSKYTKSSLEKFNISNCRFDATPLFATENLKKLDDGAKKVGNSLSRSLIRICYIVIQLWRSSFSQAYSQGSCKNHVKITLESMRYLLKLNMALKNSGKCWWKAKERMTSFYDNLATDIAENQSTMKEQITLT